ncbi:unnamed protein product, partial [Oppiella nova]
MNIQRNILRNVMWASDYIRNKKSNNLRGAIHIIVHDLVLDQFTILNNDLDKIPSGELKAKELQVFIDELVTCSPTSDKMDFRWKTLKVWDKASIDETQELSNANIDVMIAMMRLQGLKYKLQGLDIVDRFYQRFITRATKYMPTAFSVIDAYQPHNATIRKMNYYMLGISFEEYRWMGEKLDVRRKNVLEVRDTEKNLAQKLDNIEKQILKTILWASDYIRKKGDTFWGSLHILFHDLVETEFTELNNELAQMSNGELKAKALQFHDLVETEFTELNNELAQMSNGELKAKALQD